MSTTNTTQGPEADAREIYSTLPPEDRYGPNWREELAASVPMNCPDWCEGKHGHTDDLFHGRIAPFDGAMTHERTLVDTESFSVALAEEEYHPSDGQPRRRYFVLNGPDCTVDPARHPSLDFIDQLTQDLAAAAHAARPAYRAIERGLHTAETLAKGARQTHTLVEPNCPDWCTETIAGHHAEDVENLDGWGHNLEVVMPNVWQPKAIVGPRFMPGAPRMALGLQQDFDSTELHSPYLKMDCDTYLTSAEARELASKLTELADLMDHYS